MNVMSSRIRSALALLILLAGATSGCVAEPQRPDEVQRAARSMTVANREFDDALREYLTVQTPATGDKAALLSFMRDARLRLNRVQETFDRWSVAIGAEIAVATLPADRARTDLLRDYREAARIWLGTQEEQVSEGLRCFDNDLSADAAGECYAVVLRDRGQAWQDAAARLIELQRRVSEEFEAG